MPAMGSGGYGPSHLPPPPKPSSSVGKAIQTGARSASRPAPRPAVPRVTDSQLPGPSNAQVTAYKRSPAYHQAVTAVFKAQPTAQKIAIIRGLARSPRAPEVPGVQQGLNSLGTNEKLKIIAALKPGAGDLTHNTLGDILSPANVYGGGKQTGAGHGGLLGVAPSYGTISPRSYLALPSRAALDIGRATAESPSVIPKTLKGFGENVAGMVAGTAELPLKAITEGPGKALSGLAQQAASDYSRRYGPLLQGNDQAFVNRIKKEGAAPEGFDAFALAGGLDAVTRPIVDAAKIAAKRTGTDNFFTRPRRELLLSGNKVRAQQLASTAGRVVGQRLEDRLRGFVNARTGELKPEAHQLAPIFQSHAIRVVHSGIAQRSRRLIQEKLLREVRGKPSSGARAIGKLNHFQRQAIYHAVQGIRVDTPENFRADLMDRAAEIKAERGANRLSFGNRIPPQHADRVDELALIDRLVAHADKIAGPKMVAFQRGEAERAQRIEAATSLHPATAEARRLRPIGDRLGIEHPDVTLAKAQQAAAESGRQATRDALTAPRASSGEGLPPRPSFAGELQSARAANTAEALRNGDRPAALAAYVAKVRAQMAKRGLPEPGYFKHFERPAERSRGFFGAFTSGSGSRAMAADKQSTWALHRAGVADTSAQAYLNGLAQSVKRPLQWRLTDEQFRSAALPTPSRLEIKAALGREKAPQSLTGNELRRVLEHRGYDMSKVMFYNPGRLAERTLSDHGLLPRGKVFKDEAQDQVSGELHHALQQDDVVHRGDAAPSEHFLTTPGYKAIPKTAFDEIHAGLKGGGLAGRAIGRVQGSTAGLILGQNPHFLIMNTLAHLFPALMGTKGAITPELLSTPLWMRGLSDTEKDQVRAFSGGRAGHFATTARLGSQAPNQIAAFGRRLDEHGLVQTVKAVNPLNAILKGEDVQSQFFRDAVMHNQVKRAAFQDMAHEFGRGVAAWESVKHIFDMKPTDRERAIIQNMPKMEELGRTAINLLGDYGRFTAREQGVFKRSFLFYSFLRHVTRTLLYVLPVRHPLAYGLLGELGQLHSQEVRKLLGGQDLPWAYGRLFFDKKQKLSSIDLTSTSPVSSPLVDVLSGGAKEIPRLISPAFGPAFDIAYGQTPTGTKVKQNAWTYLNDLFSLSYLYRQAAAVRYGLRQQQSDSVPLLHERPQNFKTAKAQQYMLAKRAARGPLKDYLLGSALGLYPKPDDARVIAQHQAARVAAKGKPKGSGGGYLLDSGSGSGSGGSGYLLP